MTFNLIIWGGPLFLLKWLNYVIAFITGWTILGPYLIHLVPRLVMLALSFISDFTVYQICNLYKHSYNQCLTTLASSYVMLIYSTRTFSNSVELVSKWVFLHFFKKNYSCLFCLQLFLGFCVHHAIFRSPLHEKNVRNRLLTSYGS